MDEPKKTDIPGPHQDNTAYIAMSALTAVAIVVVVGLGLFYGAKGRQHLDDLEQASRELPATTDTGTDSPVSTMAKPIPVPPGCEVWPDEELANCKNPAMPEICCIGDY